MFYIIMWGLSMGGLATAIILIMVTGGNVILGTSAALCSIVVIYSSIKWDEEARINVAKYRESIKDND